jgi:4-diphosphocytidyl-2-C-methyl-D-erythritol kinase
VVFDRFMRAERLMTTIREFAPAKINLTLEVCGKRSDGYYEIESLVTFADVGDVVDLDIDGATGISVSGPFAGGLSGDNILDRALTLMRDEAPELALGAVHLEKHLPVAAGIGGGSADAGALLRAVRAVNSSESIDWYGLAFALGADVPVCLRCRPAWMTGIGHDLCDLSGQVPSLSAVLVNPMAAVPADKTTRVFRALGAPPLPASHSVGAEPLFQSRSDLIDYMRERGNDLAGAATSVVPEIEQVLAVLAAAPGVEYAAVSGAGPTCFGIFPDFQTAKAAQCVIAAEQPRWWTVATTLG